MEPEGGVWLMDDPTLRWTLMNWLGPEGFLRSFLCVCALLVVLHAGPAL